MSRRLARQSAGSGFESLTAHRSLPGVTTRSMTRAYLGFDSSSSWCRFFPRPRYLRYKPNRTRMTQTTAPINSIRRGPGFVRCLDSTRAVSARIVSTTRCPQSGGLGRNRLLTIELPSIRAHDAKAPTADPSRADDRRTVEGSRAHVDTTQQTAVAPPLHTGRHSVFPSAHPDPSPNSRPKSARHPGVVRPPPEAIALLRKDTESGRGR
jgi:hypothetical protein